MTKSLPNGKEHLRFRPCKFGMLPSTLGWNNSPDNYNSTPCPFVSLPPGHSHHILMMLFVCRCCCCCCCWILPGKIIYLFFSPELNFILCLLILVCFLSQLLPDIPLPCHCIMHSKLVKHGDSCCENPVWVNATASCKEPSRILATSEMAHKDPTSYFISFSDGMCLWYDFEAAEVVLNVLSINAPKVKVKSNQRVSQRPCPLGIGNWDSSGPVSGKQDAARTE